MATARVQPILLTQLHSELSLHIPCHRPVESHCSVAKGLRLQLPSARSMDRHSRCHSFSVSTLQESEKVAGTLPSPVGARQVQVESGSVAERRVLEEAGMRPERPEEHIG